MGCIYSKQSAPVSQGKQDDAVVVADTVGVDGAGEENVVDWAAVRGELKAVMDSETYDDGSYAPILIRLGWHSSGTYDPQGDKVGGSQGAGMRFKPEKDDPENAGLHVARDLLAPIKKKYPNVSFSDLWILASYVAIEHTGGPVIEFSPGRVDASKGQNAIKAGRLPEAEHGLQEGVDEEGRINGWENLAAHLRDVFGRMGFSDKDIVALLCGGHVYGRCHPNWSGYAGAWVESPTEFSNEYAAGTFSFCSFHNEIELLTDTLDMIEDEWMLVEHDTRVNGIQIPEETRPAPGKRQYMSKWEPSEEEIANGKPNPTEMDGEKFVVKYQMMLRK